MGLPLGNIGAPGSSSRSRAAASGRLWARLSASQDRLQIALRELRHRLQRQFCKTGADLRSFAVLLNRLTEPVQAVLVPLGILKRGS